MTGPQHHENTQNTTHLTDTRARSLPSQSNPNPRPDNVHMRFVANLSPESTFIINAQRPTGAHGISTHCVGLWFGQDDKEAPEKNGLANDEVVHVPEQAWDGAAGQTLLLSALRPALRRKCISVIPPEPEFGLLRELFFAKFDLIFPLLRDEAWEKHGVMETVALKQCICLLASLDPSMRPHLRLPHTEAVLSQAEFRAHIAAAVKQSLDLDFITDKVVLLQVCTLMSMYVGNQGFGELSTSYCAQAVLHEQTLGFHVGWGDDKDKTGVERSRRIFWCVWVLDRLNAATNGRPTLIHRHDVDSRVMDSADDQPPPFRLLIRIAQLLDHTISLYRPHAVEQAQTRRIDDTFEDLVKTTAAQNLSNASLELFYLSVVILRDRSHGHQSASELQWFCASRIVAVASGEFKPSLVYWPTLPYSVTVAASVAYRRLRNSSVPYSRRCAYTLFHDGCQLLSDLSRAFLSARIMAQLGKDTMREVERATKRTRRDSIRPIQDAVTSSETVLAGDHDIQVSPNVDQPRSRQVLDLPQSLEAGVTHTTSAACSDSCSPSFFDCYDGEAGIFGNFDPNFDLNRIDAIFSANLDLNSQERTY
ncbi:hypothetical protein QQS21_000334 [Conoideocrella luteorostrata]|uniref:Xylanolytic transcriptional activator regulatory domain-containing protein n=1 Tax=Conoideocrella luteorostrata TaxID=1105319 RepID=A0AAJ0D161_9HYPO|nr:hypothetical protein QQS21_000334 [Conoideocrella luteorostrata]